MKKLLIITFFALLGFPTYSYANEVCYIKDSTSSVLLEHIKDNRIVIKNVTKAIIKDWNKEYKSVTKTLSNVKNLGSEISTMFSEIFSFNWYTSYFEYFAVFPISNKLPYEIVRDYKIIENENKWLIGYLYKLDQWGNMNILVEDACKWVKSKCELNWLKSKEILKRLIKNSSYILDLYRLSVMWRSNEFGNADKLFLVNNNFLLEIEKNYWKNAVNTCNRNKWAFSDRISKAIKEIQLSNKKWVDWKQKWMDAWALMTWNSSEESSLNTEKKVLLNELSEQWVWTSNKKIVETNLEKFNSDWLSVNNNFIANSINSISNNVGYKIGKWLKESVFDFFQKDDKQSNIDITSLSSIDWNSQTTTQIQQKISKLYESEIPFTAVWDITTEQLRSKIIKTHINLNNSIKTLEWTIKTAQNVCNSQWWGWICD